MVRRGWRLAVWLVAALMVGGLIGWAVSVFASPPKQVAGEASYVLVTASSGQVSAKVASVVTATWPVHQVAVNQASGTLTRLAVGRGDEVHAGDVLYRVDERPVVVLEGSVPAFRALSVGVEGADVKQLTRFLVAKHYLASATSKYTAAVERAVRAWQRRLGTEETGSVRRGDVVFAKSLPMRVALKSDFRLGVSLSAGTPAIEALATAPVFTATFSERQATQVSEGMPVRVESGEHTWTGLLGPLIVGSDSSVTSRVAGSKGASLCGQECTDVPVKGVSQLSGEVEVQAPVSGVTVPVAALVADADGTTAVIDAAGARHQVVIRAQARGMAVVDQLPAGTSVRVPGK